MKDWILSQGLSLYVAAVPQKEVITCQGSPRHHADTPAVQRYVKAGTVISTSP